MSNAANNLLSIIIIMIRIPSTPSHNPSIPPSFLYHFPLLPILIYVLPSLLGKVGIDLNPNAKSHFHPSLIPPFPQYFPVSLSAKAQNPQTNSPIVTKATITQVTIQGFFARCLNV